MKDDLINNLKNKLELPRDVELKKPLVGWNDDQFTRVAGKVFSNMEIKLDGHWYDDCEFTNITLLYDGDAPFQFSNSVFYGPLNVKTDSPSLSAFYQILSQANMIKEDISLLIDGRPVSGE